MSHPGKEHLQELLNMLKGAKIVDAYVDNDDGDDYNCWPVLVVDFPDHIKDGDNTIRGEVLIAQDEECNGPGALIGLYEIKELTNG